jgi:hypothetical protein
MKKLDSLGETIEAAKKDIESWPEWMKTTSTFEGVIRSEDEASMSMSEPIAEDTSDLVEQDSHIKMET